MVLTPERLGAAARGRIAEIGPDLMVCFAYGRIFGPKFLSLFPKGAINVHPSLLPRHRGPTPIEAAILEGDEVTGITIQSMALEMDAGDIFAQEEIPLGHKTTSGMLAATVAERAPALTLSVVEAIFAGTARSQPQDADEATYCRHIDDEAMRIDWTAGAARIERAVRAFSERKGPWTTLGGDRIRILEAARPPAAPAPTAPAPGGPAAETAGPAAEVAGAGAPAAPGRILGLDSAKRILVQTGDGVLAVYRLQPAGRKPMDAHSFVNGRPDSIGAVFGT